MKGVGLKRPGYMALLLALGLAGSSRANSQSYTVIDLDMFTGDYQSVGRAINNLGQVVGSSYTNGAAARGFLWDPEDGLLDLGSLGGTFTAPMAVNDYSIVVGLSYVSERPTNYHAFRWHVESGIEDLGSFGSGIYDTSQAVGINNDNVVVGASRLNSGFSTGALWIEPYGLLDLSIQLGRSVDTAQAINSRGQMIIQTSDGIMLFDNDVLVPIGRDITIYSLSDTGEAAGFIGPAGTGVPCVWDSENGLTPIPLPAPFQYGEAFGVNGSGAVVGTMRYRQGETSVTRGFLWTGDTARDLSGDGWTIFSAMGINELAQIAATGTRDTQSRALLLLPQ